MHSNKTYKLPAKKLLAELFLNNRLFVAVLILKLVLALFFASTFMSDLFAPFIKSAITNNFWHVYTDIYPVKPNAFPYPPVMLYLLALPRWVASFVWPATGPVTIADLFFIKIPLILADVVIMLLLIKWLRNVKSIMTWYWLNPIVIYVSYIHGQLDIIPTALLCASLYYLFKNKLAFFFIFLALACATKFHIIMCIPLILIYLYRTRKIRPGHIFLGLLGFVLLLVILNILFLFQRDFVLMVYNNPEQTKVLSSFFNIFNDYRIIFIPSTYIIILYLIYDFRFINKDILLIFIALSFGTVTFFIVPSQGWYLWNIPFFVYFTIRFGTKAKHLFIALNVTYFLFFITDPRSDFPLVAQFIVPAARHTNNLYYWLVQYYQNMPLIVQLVFTVLQTTLLLFCINIFRLGVLSLRKYKIYHHPYLIGICGDSGTGKSTLSQGILDLFGASNTLLVRGDDMHRWERSDEKWNSITHLDPRANWLHRDLSDLINLKEGKWIKRRHYDHHTGKFMEPVKIKSDKVIIYEGLHSFYLKQATSIYDLKIFMKPAEELRRYWKIERDVAEREQSYSEVIAAMQKRIPDAINHILNQESQADIIFSIVPSPKSVHNLDKGEVPELTLIVTCSNDIYFEELMDCLKQYEGLEIVHDIDAIEQKLIIDGRISADQISDVAESVNLSLDELIGKSPSWNDNYHGIMQLFILYYVFTQLKRTGVLMETEAL